MMVCLAGEEHSMSERVRLEMLCMRDGRDAAARWASWAADLYRRWMSVPTHYASQPDVTPLFEQSLCELQMFAERGAIS